jgi:hypothetical protein
MSRLYVYGDSYTAPNYCVNAQQSFWGLAAEQLQVDDILNVSKNGNSFDTVCQLLIGSQNQYFYDWKDDWFIIGIPPLERITIFDNDQDTEYPSCFFNLPDWDQHPTTMECHRGLVSEPFFGQDKFLVIHQDRSWVETQVLREIFLLTQWLDSKNANYLVCNLSKPLMKHNWWGPNEFVLEKIIQHPRCIVFDDTYYSINYQVHKPIDYVEHGWTGHHGPDGNKRYFERSIKPKLDSIINT